MLASSSASCRGVLLPRSAAPRPRCSRRPCGRVVLVRATATFEELRGTAAEAVAAAQAKLPALEQAKRSAAQHKEPAAEAERHWQDSHARLSSLQAEVQSAMKQLRESVVAAAGGEDAAAHALLRRHTQERLQHYRDNYSLGAGSEWKEFTPRDLPLKSIPGGRMVYQLAAAGRNGSRYVVVALAVSNPFLFDNLRGLLLHWGVSESLTSHWGQPPKGWHTSPSISTPAGDRAWQTVLGAFAPVVSGDAVPDAALYSVVLQIPLEGIMELRGGIKCVLKRTDAGQPEWIKAGDHNNGDFWLDFQPVINMFERRRAASQKAAILARVAEVVAELPPEDLPDDVREWANAMMHDEWEDDPAAESESEEEAAALVAARPREPPRWVANVHHFEQLNDLPQDRNLSHQLNNLRLISSAVAETSGDYSLLQRCGSLEGLLSQLDLQELSSRAAQQEKEHLQALYKSASDESAHLMHELTLAAESARRTAVKLRGRETEVTQRDLEAVAEQAAQELVKKSGSSSGFWPFKEERQLVFVQQKVMEVAGMDASVVVQVFVEGTKAAVAAATNPKGADAEEVDAAMVASALAQAGLDGTAASTVLAAAAEAASAAGLVGGGKRGGAAGAAAAEAEKEKKKRGTSFEYVVIGISVAEEFPDGRLKTPIMLHLGCVAHQFAKWQVPPEKWACTPDAVSGSTGSAGAAAQVPFQRYTMESEDGSPVFVDPTLFALALRLPLKDCINQGVRGVEFVLKTADGQWMNWQHGHQVVNFHAELPLPLP